MKEIRKFPRIFLFLSLLQEKGMAFATPLCIFADISKIGKLTALLYKSDVFILLYARP